MVPAAGALAGLDRAVQAGEGQVVQVEAARRGAVPAAAVPVADAAAAGGPEAAAAARER